MTEMFWMFLISSVLGCLGLTFKMCYKSKCKEVDLCCFKIMRDTSGEEKIDEIQINERQESKEQMI